jgi:hypothetical protein
MATTPACEVLPVSAFQSTNLNSKIETFTDLSDRIKRSLGYPLITLEIHPDQLFQNIQIAAEYFTKFAGYTKEFLIFDSRIYDKNRGIRLDQLFTLAKSNIESVKKVANTPEWPGADFTIESVSTLYVCESALPSSLFSDSSALSGLFEDGVPELEIVDETLYDVILSHNQTLSSSFRESQQTKASLQSEDTDATEYSNVFDYDVMDYRKVISITDFQEGSNQGINTLFTLEQTLAQQTYFSYGTGNYGFDLVSWYTMKEWMDTREKILSIKRDIKFDERTQYLQMYPQPKNSQFFGVLACYLERPLRDIVKEQWVYEYALALTKIVIGRVRSKFTGVTLVGGGNLNYELLQEGLEDKQRLEQMLLDGATSGFGDNDPPMFVVG